MQRSFCLGERVIYAKSKSSVHPGPRARNVHAFDHGDGYSYQVDKFWVVAGLPEVGKILLKTRTGKTHVVDASDPCLRRASWWEKLRYREADLAAVMREFKRLRADSTSLLRALPHGSWQRTGLHPKRGELTLERMAELAAEHTESHLARIRELRG